MNEECSKCGNIDRYCPRCNKLLEEGRWQYLKDGKAKYYKCTNEECRITEIRIKLLP